MVPWLLNHRQIWRASLLLLLGLAIFAPWGYTSDGVPPPEWCHEPYFLLENRCVGLVSGAEILSFMLLAIPQLVGQLLSGELALLARGRELLMPVFFAPFLLPLLSGAIVLVKETPRRQAIHTIILTLALVASLLLALFNPSGNPIQIWGIWLYLLAVGLAFSVELLVYFNGLMSNMENPSRSQYMKKILKFWLVFAALVVACLVGFVLYRLWYTESFGTYRRLTEVADVDNDGDLDVILVGTRWEGASTSFAGAVIWFNQGNGEFVQDEQRFGGFSTGTGDVDQDGDLDLLVLDGLLSLYLNQGGAQGGEAGIFTIHNPIRPKLKMEGHIDMGGSVSLGDLDNDGDVDGFATNCCYGAYSGDPDEEFLTPAFSWVWLNEWDPRGWLVRHSLLLPDLDGLPIPAAALGDLDGDGDLDAFAVVAKPRAGSSSSLADRVLLNDGSGMLTDSGQRLGESDGVSVALGDVDADGDLDALVGARDAARLWTNQGGEQGGTPGIFNDYAQIIAKNATSIVFLHDLDNDADLDLILTDKRQAELWWNDGQGNFTPADLSFPFSQRQALAVGDFNADGRAEIFIAQETGYKVDSVPSP